MKRFLFLALVCYSFGVTLHVQALIINEIMSNPVGDDGGREWVEIYNDGENDIDLSTVTISVKGGAFLSVTPLQGGVVLPKNGYAIISSIVSGSSKFLQDYVTYTGILLKSSISLVNTGVTSLELKVGGQSAGTPLSYTAAKEGNTYSLIQGAYSLGVPTPGAENQSASNSEDVTTSSSTYLNQATIAQTAAPSADVVLYLPFEKIVVAGAATIFSTYGMTHAGKVLERMSYTWSFGDGGQGSGSSTPYTYNYPGRYIAQVEGGNGQVSGVGRIKVRVVAPDIAIKGVYTGKYGAFIDIENPNAYELDFSQWKLSIDGATFSFPKNTLLAANSVTHLSGLAMGFASTTISSSTLIKILFPTLEEVTRYSSAIENENNIEPVSLSQKINVPVIKKITRSSDLTIKTKSEGGQMGVKTVPQQASGSPFIKPLLSKKDTRIASFLRSFFSW